MVYMVMYSMSSGTLSDILSAERAAIRHQKSPGADREFNLHQTRLRGYFGSYQGTDGKRIQDSIVYV